MKKSDVLVLGAAIGMAELAGVIGSLFTVPALDAWYSSLVRPAGTPPDAVFSPVWITLFALMGVAAFLIWKSPASQAARRTALGIFVLQLALNVLWSVLFFGLKNLAAASVEIVALWLAIAVTIFSFAKISRLAAWLLLPYLLWVSLATYLTLAFWLLN